MNLKRFALGAGALYVLGAGWALFNGGPLQAQPSGISQKVGVCDPKSAANCVKPNADGSLNVTVSGGGGGGPVTAAAGSYVTGFSPDIGTLISPPPGSLLGLITTLNTTAAAPLAAQSTHGVNIGAIEGQTASGVTPTENPTYNGGRAATSAPTPVADGQKVALQLTKTGKAVTSPYAVDDLWVTGSASSTDTAAHQLFAAAGVGLKNYVTSLQCTDSSGTDSDITLNDATGWSITIKAGAGFGFNFTTPLSTAANTALNFTMGTGVSTVKCNAQGYKAP